MNAKAIRLLRLKFVLIAMISIAGVVTFLATFLNVANFISTRREIRSVLQYFMEHPEVLSAVEYASEERPEKGGPESSDSSDASDGSDSDESGTDGIKDTSPYTFFSFFSTFDSENFLDYYRRVKSGKLYFAVVLDSDGEFLYSLPADLDENLVDEVSRYAAAVAKSGIGFGRYGIYYYLQERGEGGEIRTSFADCSTQIASTDRIFYFSLITCFGILLISFWPVWILSARIIQPEIENVERQKQFITNASHELKTPLAVIRANTELMEMMNGESEWTQSTLRQVDRMNGLIKNLVTISRAQEKADKSAMSEINVSEIITETMETYRPMAERDGKALVDQIQQGVSLVADEGTVRQLATLLLDNALKYCDDGGEITTSLTRKGKVVRLTVSNTYAEGANVDYSRFFDRFYRQDSSHNTDKGGYGIGLSIAESIVSSYNGSIGASWKNGVISFNCTLS